MRSVSGDSRPPVPSGVSRARHKHIVDHQKTRNRTSTALSSARCLPRWSTECSSITVTIADASASRGTSMSLVGGKHLWSSQTRQATQINCSVFGSDPEWITLAYAQSTVGAGVSSMLWHPGSWIQTCKSCERLQPAFQNHKWLQIINTFILRRTLQQSLRCRWRLCFILEEHSASAENRIQCSTKCSKARHTNIVHEHQQSQPLNYKPARLPVSGVTCEHFASSLQRRPIQSTTARPTTTRLMHDACHTYSMTSEYQPVTCKRHVVP